MLSLIYGVDAALREQAAERACAEAQAAEPELEIARYDGEAVEAHELLSALSTLSLFAPARLIRIRGVADRLQKDETLRLSLAQALTTLPPSLSVLFLEGRELAASHPLAEAVKAAGGRLVPCAPLAKRDFPARVGELARSLAADIEPGALALLAERCQSDVAAGGRTRRIYDLGRARTELEKLSTFVGAGGVIDRRAVQTLVPEPNEQVFALTDALSARNLARANAVLDEMLERGEPAQVIFAMLTRHVRILLLCQAGRQERGDVSFLQSGEFHLRDFALRNAERQAQAFGAARLRELFGVLVRADAAIKTGKLDAAEAVRLLAASICSGGDLLPALA